MTLVLLMLFNYPTNVAMLDPVVAKVSI